MPYQELFLDQVEFKIRVEKFFDDGVLWYRVELPFRPFLTIEAETLEGAMRLFKLRLRDWLFVQYCERPYEKRKVDCNNSDK